MADIEPGSESGKTGRRRYIKPKRKQIIKLQESRGLSAKRRRDVSDMILKLRIEGESDGIPREWQVTLFQRRCIVNELYEEGAEVAEIIKILNTTRDTVNSDLAWIKEERRRGIGENWVVNEFVDNVHRLANHAQWCHGMSEKAIDHRDKISYRQAAIAAESERGRRLGGLLQAEAARRIFEDLGKPKLNAPGATDVAPEFTVGNAMLEPLALAKLLAAFSDAQLIPEKLVMAAIDVTPVNGNVNGAAKNGEGNGTAE